jgi:hypothetical protein
MTPGPTRVDRFPIQSPSLVRVSEISSEPFAALALRAAKISKIKTQETIGTKIVYSLAPRGWIVDLGIPESTAGILMPQIHSHAFQASANTIC